MKRYEELISLYFDGEPTQAELDELAELLSGDPALAKDLREQLTLWESWSQFVAPERSAESFIAALKTRLNAEKDANKFRASAMRRLKPKRLPFVLAPLMAAAALITLACVYFFIQPDGAESSNFMIIDAKAQLVSIKGECVCTKCTLNQEGQHNKAVRYEDSKSRVQLLVLKNDSGLREYTGHFCGGPTPVLVQGNLVSEAGEEFLAMATLDFGESEMVR